MTTRAEIVAEAKTWLGTRWHHQQARKGVGVDCFGIIVGVARARGLPEMEEFDHVAEAKGYGREPDAATMLVGLQKLPFLEPATEILPGNILYLRIPEVKHAVHFAIVSDGGRMIHANVAVGRVVENRLDNVWRSRIARIYAYRGVDG